MSNIISTRYTCETCRTTRSLSFDPKEISYQIFKPKDSPNGLIIYSDIHRCENGILGINNLHIDDNSAVRSLEFLKLPSEKNRSITIEGIPTPSIPNKEQFEIVRVSGMARKDGFRITILDKELGIHLVIGDIKLDQEQPLTTIVSEKNSVEIKFYRANVELTDQIASWLRELVNLLEQLPPTKVGLFIDTLRYIHKLQKIPPASFHINMLKTILSSHKVSFELINENSNIAKQVDDQVELYGNEAVELMKELVNYLKTNPNSALQQFTKTHHHEISHLVYMFLLLEQDGIIRINRPAELDEFS